MVFSLPHSRLLFFSITSPKFKILLIWREYLTSKDLPIRCIVEWALVRTCGTGLINKIFNSPFNFFCEVLKELPLITYQPSWRLLVLTLAAFQVTLDGPQCLCAPSNNSRSSSWQQRVARPHWVVTPAPGLHGGGGVTGWESNPGLESTVTRWESNPGLDINSPAC